MPMGRGTDAPAAGKNPIPMNEQGPLSRSFGHDQVSEQEREHRIRAVFESVAPRYDLLNDLLSFGIHRLWKRTLVTLAAPAAGQHIVDLAGGTGDVAARMAAPGRQVTVIDPSEAMMRVGRARGLPHVGWKLGVAEQLPLADASVDTLTIAFGMRNATRIDTALREALRVLKPGGRFLCLEFSTPAPWLRAPYRWFSFALIPRLGGWIAGTPKAYVYLVESIRRFPDQRAFQRLIEDAGFGAVHYRNLSFGIACIHVGTRPVCGAADSPPSGV
jgi:demethylmenaquinone methyltransferase / 2-methoxy-6-polyprenyl-1,4-benzoquinol methylase